MKARLSGALALVALAHLSIELCGNYLPVLYPVVMETMGLSFTQVGLIALVATTSMALAQPIFGYFSDRWGPERISALSIVWIGLAMGLVGFAPNYAILLLLIALGSLGSAAFHPPSAVIAAANSGKHRGSGMSFFSAGGNIGAALSPIWMTLAFATLGLHGTITLIPLGIVMGAVIYVQLRRQQKLSKFQTDKPQATVAHGYLVGLILIVVGMMFRSWFQLALITYLPIFVEDSGGTLASGARLLAVFMFSISIGSLVGGPLGDRYGYWQVIIASLLLLPLTHWLFMTSAIEMQTVALILSGVAVGSTFPTSIVLVIEAWPHQVGVATGLLMGLGWWPGGLGASFTGYLADHYSLPAAFYALMLAPLVAVICVLVYAFLSRSRTAVLRSAPQ